ncbi:MAG: HU family DNA-binding protein [Chloroflexia bacterium]|nr:HU family DNA-binding protein [Chloroflexia bacterium]
MANICKNELIERIASRTHLSAAAVQQVVEVMLDEVGAALARGDKISLIRFGVFDRRHFPARTGVHPRTGEPMPYPERYAPSFRASMVLKRRVRGQDE